MYFFSGYDGSFSLFSLGIFVYFRLVEMRCLPYLCLTDMFQTIYLQMVIAGVERILLFCSVNL